MAIDRRAFLTSGSAIAAAAVAGCSGVKTLLGGPDPKVVDAQSGQSLSGAITGQYTIHILVENNGGTGKVKVVVRTRDGDGTVLDRYHKVVTIEKGSRRRVDFDIEPSSDAEQYDAKAEPA